MACLYHSGTQTYCSLYALGESICGHKTVVHGGKFLHTVSVPLHSTVMRAYTATEVELANFDSYFCCLLALLYMHIAAAFAGFTSALIDDALGGLVYILKQEGAVTGGPSYTVHLEIDYKAPVQACTVICCTTQLIENSGRKAWVKAIVEVTTKPESTMHWHVCAAGACRADCEALYQPSVERYPYIAASAQHACCNPVDVAECISSLSSRYQSKARSLAGIQPPATSSLSALSRIDQAARST